MTFGEAFTLAAWFRVRRVLTKGENEMYSARFICLVLAILFFLFAAFNFPRWSRLDGELALVVSWRDLAYAMVVLSFLV